MKRARRPILAIIGVFLTVVVVAAGWIYYKLELESDFTAVVSPAGEASVTVPPGFAIGVYAQDLRGPRFIAFGPDGRLYVAERGANRIVALVDEDSDGRSDTQQVFAAELDRPHSLAYYQGAWYVGLPGAVVRLTDADGDGIAESRAEVVQLPANGSHTTRTVAFLPDGRMVVSIGSTCNACQEADPRRATVVVYNGPEGGNERIFARGLRNAVGLAVHPQTGELWSTNNGRDRMGDDLPPETVYIVREGADYGWPRCHSGDVPDPELGGPGACDGVTQPVVQMQAHSAPLGLAFYDGRTRPDGRTFPEAYQGDLFIAFHGSWNRSTPTGYKVVRLPLDGSSPAGPVEDFAVGWLDEQTEEASGRPVGLAVGPDGALYISDDKGGFIYRVWYRGEDGG